MPELWSAFYSKNILKKIPLLELNLSSNQLLEYVNVKYIELLHPNSIIPKAPLTYNVFRHFPFNVTRIDIYLTSFRDAGSFGKIYSLMPYKAYQMQIIALSLHTLID